MKTEGCRYVDNDVYGTLAAYDASLPIPTQFSIDHEPLIKKMQISHHLKRAYIVWAVTLCPPATVDETHHQVQVSTRYPIALHLAIMSTHTSLRS